MATNQLVVIDANGARQTVYTNNINGAALSANSSPVVLSTDQALFPIADTVFYNESVTPILANATFTGTAKNTGATAGGLCDACFFNAFILTDQTGIMRIEMSNDNVTWIRATIDTAIVANTPLFLKTPIVTKYYRVIVTNGTTLQTILMINSSYTSS
jgi:hypothetical protein